MSLTSLPFLSGSGRQPLLAEAVAASSFKSSSSYSSFHFALGRPEFVFVAARALLPAEDEDDEELVGLAKSRRKERMAEERRVQESFVNKADYTGADVVRVQNAVNKLAKGGLSLEAGDLSPLANARSGP